MKHLDLHTSIKLNWSHHYINVYVVMTIFSTNQSQCASFSKNMVTLLLLFMRVTTAHNLLIDSHHYKRRKKNILTAFHSLSLFTLTTIQLNPLFLKTLNYSVTIQRLVLSFRNLHSFHSNAPKT